MQQYIPKKTKYIKIRKGKIPTLRFKGDKLNFGTYGLKSVESGILAPKQIETGRRVIKREIREFQGIVWVRILADTQRTNKPSEQRMGRGKGRVDSWVSKIPTGKVLYEVDNVEEKLARLALNKAAAKLPFKVKIIEE